MLNPISYSRRLFLLGAVATLLVGWPLLHAETQVNSENELRMEYAKTRLALAETKLQQVQRMNSRVRGAVSTSVVNEYRRDLSVARRHLESLESGDGGDDFRL